MSARARHIGPTRGRRAPLSPFRPLKIATGLTSYGISTALSLLALGCASDPAEPQGAMDQEPAVLTVTPDSIVMAALYQNASVAAEALVQQASGGETGQLAVDTIMSPSGGPITWLEATLLASTPPAGLRLVARPETLDPGEYDARVTVVSDSGATVTAPVRLAVRVASAVVAKYDELKYFPVNGESITDSLQVDQEGEGPLGNLSIVVAPEAPWLQITLRAEMSPTHLVYTIDGTQVALDTVETAVEVIPSSLGATGYTLGLQAAGDPPPLEVREWNPMCVDGGILSPTRYPVGVRACASIKASVWPHDQGRRVVIEAANLHESLGDANDTADFFELERWGFSVYPDSFSAVPQLVSVEPRGKVLITGTPIVSDLNARFRIQGDGFVTGSVLGCSSAGEARAASHYRTCPDEGATGALRTSFLVTDTTWTLLDTKAEFSGLLRHGSEGVAFSCSELADACGIPGETLASPF